jgi:DNA-binding CsgD family transcriptional regulator
MLPETESALLLQPDAAAAPHNIDLHNVDLRNIDLRDASSSLANTCEALRLTLLDGDLDAAKAVWQQLVDQLPDLSVAVGELLQPMLTEMLEEAALAPPDRQRVMSTACDLLRGPADGPEGRTSHRVWLSNAHGDVEPLIVHLVAMLVRDVGVPTRVLEGPTSIAHVAQLPVRPHDVMFLCLPPLTDLAELLTAMNWFHQRDVLVVIGGRGIRDVPELARMAGAHAGAWSVSDAAAQLLRARGPLTDAESAAVRMAADGYTNVRIAHELGISVSAVKARLEGAYQRMHAADRAHAVAIALRNRWIS